jgi:hypothetical protein
MRFGNWKLTDTTVEWAGQALQRFVIEKQSLTETISIDQTNHQYYKWIVLATEEEWLADDDLYDLNFAFVFAAGTFKMNFDYETFDRTVEYQFELLDEEEEETEP